MTTATTADYRKTLARTMSESALQRHVLDAAKKLGWMRMHCRPARAKDGGQWLTHITGEVGFPDLVLARPGRQPLFIELKREDGEFREGQREWLEALGENAYCFRPHSWLSGEIERLLR